LMASSTLSEWFSKFPTPIDTPTNQMQRWQKTFQTGCAEVCCWSKDCGSIHCNGCGHSLTKSIPVVLRFVCMECDVDKDQQALMSLCESCFNSDELRHHHTRFCQISSQGRHTPIERTKGFGELRQITKDDIKKHCKISPIPSSATECVVCFIDFEPEKCYPYTMPGCKTHNHSLGQVTQDGKFEESHAYTCLDCTFETIKAGGFTEYCTEALPCLCTVCCSQQEEAQWRKEFSEAFQILVENFNNTKTRKKCVV